VKTAANVPETARLCLGHILRAILANRNGQYLFIVPYVKISSPPESWCTRSGFVSEGREDPFYLFSNCIKLASAGRLSLKVSSSPQNFV
jgi:hypothetical protein